MTFDATGDLLVATVSAGDPTRRHDGPAEGQGPISASWEIYVTTGQALFQEIKHIFKALIDSNTTLRPGTL